MRIQFPNQVKFTRTVYSAYRKLLIPYAYAFQANTDSGIVILQRYHGANFEMNHVFVFNEGPVDFDVHFEEPALMLSYLLDGELTYIDEGMGPDASLLPGKYHLSYENTGSRTLSIGKGYMEYLQFDFSDALIQHMDNVPAAIKQVLDAFEQKADTPLHTQGFKITARIRKIAREITGYRGDFVNLFIQSKLNELLLQLLHSASVQEIREPLMTGDVQKLDAIMHYIEFNLEKPLTVEALAKQFGYAPNVLHKKFKQYHGVTPYQHIQERRLLKAKRLLTSGSGHSVKQVAEMCGYSESTNFLTAFKKRFGYTTSQLVERQEYTAQINVGINTSKK